MNPFASIDEDRPKTAKSAPASAPKSTPPTARPTTDHTEARKVYAAYLTKLAELRPHQEYCRMVCAATAGSGMTPVRPLATLGCGGGPLLCDVCGKAILLEGGQYNKVPADIAWERAGRKDFRSWISGGLVVEEQSNGTLRIYHGYAGRPNDCCEVARRAGLEASEKFTPLATRERLGQLVSFLRDEFSDKTQGELNALLTSIVNTVLSYDPGIGVNRPS